MRGWVYGIEMHRVFKEVHRDVEKRFRENDFALAP